MKYILTILSLAFLSNAIAQTPFEGKIDYQYKVESKLPHITSQQMNTLIGTKQEYFIKGENYKSILNGLAIIEQLYDPKANRLYNETPKSDTLYWFDGLTNTDAVLSVEEEKNAVEILGFRCNALVIKTISGVTTYYYNAKFKMSPGAFKSHHFNNWSLYASKAQALPLKAVTENKQFKMEMTATAVTPQKLSDSFFLIPANIPVKQMGKNT